MIDFARLDDPEYFNSQLKAIDSLDDMQELANILSLLSIKLTDKSIDPVNAHMILEAVKARQAELVNFKNSMRQNKNAGGRQLSLTPTSVSNRAGAVSIVFLVVNIAIITAMYTLLFISKFIKWKDLSKLLWSLL